MAQQSQGSTGHVHGHDHHGLAASPSERRRNRGRLKIVLLLVSLYMVAEVVGGILTNSLALLADAGHMLSDAAALALALFALWIAERPAQPRYTYGYYRAEILAAVVNAAALLAVAVFIFIEAYRRLTGEPGEVQGLPMMLIATGGLVINIVGLVILSGGRKGSLNMRGAWLHVLSDAFGSIGTIAAGVLILAFGWHWADPLASVLIGLLVLVSGWHLLREATDVLMAAAPPGIDPGAVRRELLEQDHVLDVHDLHVWTITSGMPALSAHVVVSERAYENSTLEALRRCIHEEFGIEHITLQMEKPELAEKLPPV